MTYTVDHEFEEQPEEGAAYLQPEQEQKQYSEWYVNEILRTTGNAQDRLINEIERLKGLIEDAYIQGRNDEKGVSEIIGWQQFKSENNL